MSCSALNTFFSIIQTNESREIQDLKSAFKSFVFSNGIEEVLNYELNNFLFNKETLIGDEGAIILDYDYCSLKFDRKAHLSFSSSEIIRSLNEDVMLIYLDDKPLTYDLYKMERSNGIDDFKESKLKCISKNNNIKKGELIELKKGLDAISFNANIHDNYLFIQLTSKSDKSFWLNFSKTTLDFENLSFTREKEYLQTIARLLGFQGNFNSIPILSKIADYNNKEVQVESVKSILQISLKKRKDELGV